MPDEPDLSPPLVSYLGLLAIPAVAIAVYTLATWLGLRWQTNWVLYAITTPAGFVMFLLSLGRSGAAKPRIRDKYLL